VVVSQPPSRAWLLVWLYPKSVGMSVVGGAVPANRKSVVGQWRAESGRYENIRSWHPVVPGARDHRARFALHSYRPFGFPAFANLLVPEEEAFGQHNRKCGRASTLEGRVIEETHRCAAVGSAQRPSAECQPKHLPLWAWPARLCAARLQDLPSFQQRP
jgi:hypothetical protein